MPDVRSEPREDAVGLLMVEVALTSLEVVALRPRLMVL